MKYQEAVDSLLKGLFVTREVWNVQNGYLAYMPGITHFLRVNTQPKPEVIPWAVNVEDSIADDWTVINPFAEKVEVQKVDAA